MPLPGWLARFNRRVSNPALRPLLDLLPYFGVVLHRGRKSGRVYRTPVMAFPRHDGFAMALTYGRRVDWLRNVLAASGCRLVYRGRPVDLVNPTVLPLRDVASAIPGWVRAILRLLRVENALLLRDKSSAQP